ncbi:MAG TPA: helix-hairpin-helix domain-containing protein, partial [Chitinophagaceae bacterium]
WGMPVGFYERVKGYIQITAIQNTYTSNAYQSAYKPVEKKPLLVDINEADTTAFIALPGIGSKLAARIVNFRDKLGGFHSINQVGETYGVPDSTFQYIRTMLVVSNTRVKKININTVTKDELKLHPYIRWNLANAIIEYRLQHGKYSDLNQLKQIAIIDEATFNKIVPYLTTSSLENE